MNNSTRSLLIFQYVDAIDVTAWGVFVCLSAPLANHRLHSHKVTTKPCIGNNSVNNVKYIGTTGDRKKNKKRAAGCRTRVSWVTKRKRSPDI